MMSAMSVNFGCGGCGCQTALPPQTCGCHGSMPAMTPPAAAQSAVLRPAMSQPAMTQPAMTPPAASRPAMPQPAMTVPQDLSQLTCRQLMDLINQASFAVDEAVLYLDTHPDDPVALNYYHQAVQLRLNAMNTYHQSFGPLMADQVSSNRDWTWINGPWPWEGGCVCGDMKNACNTR